MKNKCSSEIPNMPTECAPEIDAPKRYAERVDISTRSFR